MTDFVRRIDEVLLDKNLKRTALCSDLGLSQTAITDWARRGTVPAGDICLKIADYLGVSVEWLISGKEAGLSTEQRALLSQWSKLSADQKDTIQILLDKWEADRKTKEKKENL